MLGGFKGKTRRETTPVLGLAATNVQANRPGTQYAIPVYNQPTIVTTLPAKHRNELLKETSDKEANLPLLSIVRSHISLYSWKDMQRIAGQIPVTTLEITGHNSVNDPRMGNVSLNESCQNCHQIDCPGHYGLIDFGTMIYNPAFIREIVQILTCVCNDCGQFLIPQAVMIKNGFNKLSFDKRLSKLEEYCSKDVTCLNEKPTPGPGQGPVRPCAKNPFFIASDVKDNGEITYKVPQGGTRKIAKEDKPEIMPIEQVATILDKISDSTARALGFPPGSHPRNLIIRGILVLPIIARPPVFDGSNVHHDQITHMYIMIVRKIKDIAKGKATVKDLYTTVKQLIFKTEGKKMGTREVLSILERIQGKTALMRGSLMGKRNNDCGRTVGGPESSKYFGQMRIPQTWAPILTKKITVNNINMKFLTQLLHDGKITHIKSKKTGLRRYYNSENKDFHYTLKVGDVVERWLRDDDRIVINRQPTLHRQSMMGYKVALGPQLTIGSHLSVTTPMNLDYDGDENNGWCPQDLEVEAEVEYLLNVIYNIMSAEQNKPSMGLVMNSVTGSYLISHPDTRINDDLFAELLDMITHKNVLTNLYARLIKYGVHPRSGNAAFSALLPSDFYYEQGDVIIYEGVLISGRLKKSYVGTAHRSIIQELHKEYGPVRTADFFTDAPKLINKWLIERGFSVGIRDCINLAKDNNGVEYDKNRLILEQELSSIYIKLEALGGQLKDPMEESYRQRQINNLVNIASGVGLRLSKEILANNNSIGVMTDQGAGTKGAIANIGQILGLVGQQYYRGTRLKPTITNGTRLLPIFDENDNNPEANAFIPESFFQGVRPEGLFFLQAGGREGLLDTALKTAETGSMSHRMVKAFENIIIWYDGSIRNTIGTLFAPIYNSGYDVAEMLAVKMPDKTDFSSFMDIKRTVSKLNMKRGWVTASAQKLIQEKKANLFQNPKDKLPEETILPVPDQSYVKGPPIMNTNHIVDISQPIAKSEPRIKITKFEKARIIGTRATQIANNAPPLVDIGDEIDPIKIADMEYNAGVLELYVIRKFADGSYQTVFPTLQNI